MLCLYIYSKILIYDMSLDIINKYQPTAILGKLFVVSVGFLIYNPSYA